MNFLKFGILALAAVTILTACEKESPPPPPPAAPVSAAPALPTQAQPKLPTITLYIGAKEVEAEVADDWQKSSAGLMFRTSMPEDSGMLFLLPLAQASFWMKNCSLPLSIAYISQDSTIEEIHDLEPHNTNSVKSKSTSIAFALEMNRDWFKKNGIEPGAAIRTPKGTLMETFSPKR